MKTEKQIKEAAKAFYTFCNKYINKYQNAKLEIVPGLIANVRYSIDFDNEDIELQDLDLKISKEVKVFEDVLGIDFSQYVWDADLHEKIDIDDLYYQYNILWENLNEAIYGDNEGEYDFYLKDYTDGTLTEFYEAVLETVEEKKEEAKKPKEIKMALTDDYFAIVNKPHGRIHVGCQRIPIEKVRELVKLYDEA